MADVKGHVVCAAFPLQGHIVPMLKLAQLLHSKGFHITFVTAEYCSKNFSGDPFPSFNFQTLPIPPPSPSLSPSQALMQINSSCKKNFKHLFRNLLARLIDSDLDVPPVTCVLSDACLSYSVEVAREVGIHCVLFWIIGASAVVDFRDSRLVIQKCFQLLKEPDNETNPFLDTTMDYISGAKRVRLRDLPNYIRASNLDEYIAETTTLELARLSKASALVINTFEALEHEKLKILSSSFPVPIYTVGPLNLFRTQRFFQFDQAKVDLECLQWLDKQQPNSVLYISFGSVANISREELLELAWGVASSKHPFLFVLRPPGSARDDEGAASILPQEFLEETKDRSLVAGWCPQEQVLEHSAVGGFMTHCGWNSIMESISNGVPLICWPHYADNFRNCEDCCSEWGIGLAMERELKREEVEKLVIEFMEGEKGKKTRKMAKKWKELAQEAIDFHGSSSKNLDSLVKEELLSRKESVVI